MCYLFSLMLHFFFLVVYVLVTIKNNIFMKRPFFTYVFTLGLMLAPTMPVLAHNRPDFNAKNWKIELRNDEKKEKRELKRSVSVPTCRYQANQKMKLAVDAAKLVYKQAEIARKAKYANDVLLAQRMKDLSLRESAMLDARFASEDSQIAAQAVLRQATRAAQRQVVVDHSVCRSTNQVEQTCIKTADQKSKDTIHAAESVYKAALASAKVTLTLAREAAAKLTDPNQRLAAMQSAQNAFEDTQDAAETVLRQARRSAQQQQLTDRKVCLPAV